MVELKTFRAPEETIAGDPRERTDGDTTVWSYDEGSGLMTAKTYADGHGETYSYDGWNRLVAKSQARTVDEQGTHLMTTYGYDELTGNLLSVTHNDATPAIGYTYNHLNLLTQVTDDYGTRTFSYNQYNEAVQEIRQVWWPAGLTIKGTVWDDFLAIVCNTKMMLFSNHLEL